MKYANYKAPYIDMLNASIAKKRCCLWTDAI